MTMRYDPNLGWVDDGQPEDQNYAGGSPTFTEAAPQGTMPAPSPTSDTPTKAQLPAPASFAPATADPSLLGPNFSGPAPASFGGPATSADQVPVPGVNPGVVYTDQAGKGYTPDQLYTNRNTLLQDPANARIRDILPQYGYGGPSSSAAAPAAAGGASGGGGSSGAGGPAAAPSSAFNDQIRKILMARLAQAQTPVDPNSPEITATMSAASDAGTRASDAERTALAERLYAQGGGLNTDALTRQVQQSGEKQAGTLSTLKASLLTNQYNQKRQDLQSLLSLAIQSGDAESARAIQLQIANLQAAVQREGLGINLAEFGATLDQNSVLAGMRG